MATRLTVVLVSLLLATPALIFWLWLVILPPRTVVNCPEDCDCYDAEMYIYCTNNTGNDAHYTYPAHTAVLGLRKYNIPSLKKDFFLSRGLTELKTIILWQCGIATIELGAFNGLTELTRLRLWHNEISEILPRTFEKLSSLEILGLSSNRIEYLDVDVFCGLINLKSIYLNYNNITYIHPHVFVGLHKLKDVDLEGNTGLQIPTDSHFINSQSLSRLDISNCSVIALSAETFANVTALEWLDLSYNNITYIHPHVFVGLHKLKDVDLEGNTGLQIPTDSHFINSQSLSRLDISNCNVSSVSAETFANVTALEWLDLSYNNLTSVDINILKELPKLSAMYLDNNPLQCDCQLQEVWRWYQDHNIETAYWRIGPECDTPSEVQGKYWGLLETFQCLQDNITYSGDYENTKYSYTPTEYSSRGENIEHFFTTYKTYQMPIYALLCIFGTAGNVILIIIIICNKDMRTVSNMYILNLAVSDIIYLNVHFLETYAKAESEVSSADIRRSNVAFFRRLSVGLSAYSVAVLSIQRYRVTVNPLHVHVSSRETWRGIIGIVCGVWIVAVLFSIPSTIALDDVSVHQFSVQYYRKVVVFELLVSSVVPACVIVFCYTMTARHVLKSADSVSQHTQSPHLNTRKRAANTVLGLAFVFLISNLPYHVLWAYHTHNAKWHVFKDGAIDHFFNDGDIAGFSDEILSLYTVSLYLLLINSCLNPVALLCTSRAFKKQIKRYLTCSCKANSPVSNFELSTIN